MGGKMSNLKRFIRCSSNKNNKYKMHKDGCCHHHSPKLPSSSLGAIQKSSVSSSNNSHHHHHHKNNQFQWQQQLAAEADPKIRAAFYALSDDPLFISRWQFEESFAHSLGPTLWKFLQEEEDKTMNFEQFVANGKMLSEMPLSNYAQMGVHPDKLLRICLECSGIKPIDESSQDFIFLHKLAEHIGNESEQIVAWTNKNCPRLFQSIHEYVISKFLGIPKSIIEESTFGESEILSKAEMFFLKHNLPREIYYFMPSLLLENGINSNENGQQQEKRKSKNECLHWQWELLYRRKQNDINIEDFKENVFKFDGSTVSIFRMNSDDEIFVLALDEKWRNSIRPFGGPYTVLFMFEPEFQRIEREPPAFHCNFEEHSWLNSVFFNGGSKLAIRNDLSNVNAIEIWGCCRLKEAKAMEEMPKIGEEEQKIMKKLRHEEKKNGVRKQKQQKGIMEERWEENVDKKLLEMDGFKFADNHRQNDEMR